MKIAISCIEHRLLIGSCIWLALLGYIMPVLGGDQEALEVLDAAYEQWRDEVSFTSTFTFRRGLASNLDEAQRGNIRLADGPNGKDQATGWFNKMGKHWRLGLDYGAAPISVAHPSGDIGDDDGRGAEVFVSFDEMTNGELQALYWPRRGTFGDDALITERAPQNLKFSAAGPSSGSVVTPLRPALNLFEDSPYRLRPPAEPGSKVPTKVDVRSLENGMLEVVLQRNDSGMREERTVWVDSTGPLPVVTEIRSVWTLPDGVRVEDHAWLSDFHNGRNGAIARRVIFAQRRIAAGANKGVSVAEWRSHDLGNRPASASDFVIQLPESTSVRGLAGPLATGGIRQIDLSQLSRTDVAIPKRGLPLPAPVSSNARRTLLLAAIVSSGVVVVLILMLVKRRQRVKDSHDGLDTPML